MTIQMLIDKAIKRLEREGKLLTPDFYAEAFCKEAQLASIQTEDCNQVERFKQTLNKEFQKEIDKYRVKSVSELIRFLISKLNRTNPTKNAELLEVQNDLTKRISQVVLLLHNKEASILAQKTIEMLDASPTSVQIEQFIQLWSNFSVSYDDTYLEQLSTFATIDKENLKKTISSLDISTIKNTQNISTEQLDKIASSLVSSFVPSIASIIDETIATLSKKIEQNPNLLLEDATEEQIRTAISLRIALDKESLSEMVVSLDGVVAKLSQSLLAIIKKSDSTAEDIQKIKDELDSYKEENITDFKVAHTKLYKIAVTLETNTKMLSKELQYHNGQVKIMGAKIEELEKELKKAKEESKEDFLTKLYNKRALNEFLHMHEASYNRLGHTFSIIFFDLDHFKKINDTYGHEAGDAVLSAFAKILKKESRASDIIGRYGGEEFIALLADTPKEAAAIFAEKVRAQVAKTKFLFRGTAISVNISCGVSERTEVKTLKQLLEHADAKLYKAKNDGRNRVVS